MQAPELTEKEALLIIPNHVFQNIKYINKGGQKTVFSCEISGATYALKFLDITPLADDVRDTIQQMGPDDEIEPGYLTENLQHDVLERAKREIAIMQRCDTPTLVKLGPVGMTLAEFDNKRLLYFTEDWILGEDLHNLFKSGPISIADSIELGLDIATAIMHLWNIRMVHRDIKPKNIMRRTSGTYVLLDTGLAFDLADESLTAAFQTVGTRIYMSPEQLTNYKRELDFRSDLFVLGIVLYEGLCGQHPFYKRGMNSMQIVSNIMLNPLLPLKQLRSDIPDSLNFLIMRLLAKEPHLRFKSCESFIQKLTMIKEQML